MALVKYTLRSGNDYSDVLEVDVPDEVVERYEDDPGALAKWIRDYRHKRRGYVRLAGSPDEAIVFGVDRDSEGPSQPRVSLPAGADRVPKGSKPTEDQVNDSIRLASVVRGRVDTIRLDWDDTTLASARARAAKLGLGKLGAVRLRRSASGHGTHAEVRLTTPVRAVVGLHLRQAWMDDPKRLWLDALRAKERDGASAIEGVLFDRKGSKKAGPWNPL